MERELKQYIDKKFDELDEDFVELKVAIDKLTERLGQNPLLWKEKN